MGFSIVGVCFEEVKIKMLELLVYRFELVMADDVLYDCSVDNFRFIWETFEICIQDEEKLDELLIFQIFNIR